MLLNLSTIIGNLARFEHILFFPPKNEGSNMPKKIPNKGKVFRICFAGFMAATFYFILFLWQIQNNDGLAVLQRFFKNNVSRTTFCSTCYLS